MKFDSSMLTLYAVTGDRLPQKRTLLYQLEEVLKGGATCVQLRQKRLTGAALLQEALAVKALCARYGVPFLVNDDPLLAAAIDADGVHLGADDMPISDARCLLGPDKIIGATVRTVAQAVTAAAQGADYLGSGAMFPTGSKADAALMTRETLTAICAAVRIPVVAIGGITEENLPQLAGTGIHGVAVINALFSREDPRTAAVCLRALSQAAISLGKPNERNENK